MNELLPLSIFLPFAGALLIAVAGRLMGRACGWVSIGVAVLALGVLGLFLQQTGWSGGQQVLSWPWIPQLGVDFNLMVDGLSVFFGLVVLVIGVLVLVYAAGYMGDDKRLPRFHASMLFFMGSMMGTVFSDNLLLLFVFWEMTGLASFLLIGFQHEKESSRNGARMAFLVTGGTGLVMLVGLALLGILSNGVWQVSRLDSSGISASPSLTVAVLLVLVGAFGKSAQIPFQFWLPNAMAAPTPVSAYLHSAAMVKLGVFLVARIYSVFHQMEFWAPLLMAVGLGTATYAAFLALRAMDLKAILAFTTVAYLGQLMAMYGLGACVGLRLDLFHILNHVLYKCCLFMCVGIIDHSTGRRNLLDLGGAGRLMPVTSGLLAVGVLSMAGFPGTAGFFSKEYYLKDLFMLSGQTGAWGTAALWVFCAASAMTIFTVFRMMGVLLGGKPGPDVREHFHAPGFLIQVSPAVLAAAVLVLGAWPQAITEGSRFLMVEGMQVPLVKGVMFYDGSAGVLATSLALVGVFGVWGWRSARSLRPSAWPGIFHFENGFERLVSGIFTWSKASVKLMGADKPRLHLPTLSAVFLGLLASALLWGGGGALEGLGKVPWSSLAGAGLRVPVALLILASALGVVLFRRWQAQLISLSVSGLLVTFYFFLYKAPDLALTQLLVETVTLLMFLLLLSRFRDESGDRPAQFRWSGLGAVRIALAGAAAVTVSLVLLLVPEPYGPEHVGHFYLQTTVELAGGTNAVNTIIVDYRALDTFGEALVLVIAMLGALGLFMRRRRAGADSDPREGRA